MGWFVSWGTGLLKPWKGVCSGLLVWNMTLISASFIEPPPLPVEQELRLRQQQPSWRVDDGKVSGGGGDLDCLTIISAVLSILYMLSAFCYILYANARAEKEMKKAAQRKREANRRWVNEPPPSIENSHHPGSAPVMLQFLSGNWRGYYSQCGRDDTIRTFDLTFSRSASSRYGTIQGSGEDDVGKYTITNGHYNRVTGRLAFTKQYIRGTGNNSVVNRGQEVEYRGTMQEHLAAGVIGQWSAINYMYRGEGNFHIYPLRSTSSSSSSSSQSSESDTASTTNWEDYWWADLPEDIQAAAVLLGYNEETWNNDLPVFADDLDWEELDTHQQNVAVIFGYDQNRWNCEEHDDRSGNWDDYSWSELPPDIQRAASDLEYDLHTWDTDEPVSTEGLDWEQLTPDQQRAAELLGYDQQRWDEDHVNDTAATSNSDWDDFWWEELPEEIQAAAVVLGYNETTWNNELPVFSDGLDWEEMNTQQKSVAVIFGYDQNKWNKEKGCFDCIDNDNNHDNNNLDGDVTNWDNYWWSELPPVIQEAAQVLGYDQHRWDDGESVSCDALLWVELSAEQRHAAEMLGYVEQTWDSDGDDLSPKKWNDKLYFSASTENECIVCFDASIDVILRPCGHLAVCGSCGEKLKVCPICRTSIKSRESISCCSNKKSLQCQKQ